MSETPLRDLIEQAQHDLDRAKGSITDDAADRLIDACGHLIDAFSLVEAVLSASSLKELTFSDAEIDLIVEGLTQREMWGSGDALVDRLEAFKADRVASSLPPTGEQEGSTTTICRAEEPDAI